MINRRMTTVIA